MSSDGEETENGKEGYDEKIDVLKGKFKEESEITIEEDDDPENIIKKQFYFESLAFVHCENRAAIKLFDKNGYLPVSVNDYCYYLRKILW